MKFLSIISLYSTMFMGYLPILFPQFFFLVNTICEFLIKTSLLPFFKCYSLFFCDTTHIVFIQFLFLLQCPFLFKNWTSTSWLFFRQRRKTKQVDLNELMKLTLFAFINIIGAFWEAEIIHEICQHLSRLLR